MTRYSTLVFLQVVFNVNGLQVVFNVNGLPEVDHDYVDYVEICSTAQSFLNFMENCCCVLR